MLSYATATQMLLMKSKVKFIRRGDFWDESQRISRIFLAYMGRKGTLHMGNNEMMSRERSTLGHVWWSATGKMVLNQSNAYALQTSLTRASVIVFLPFAYISGKSCQLDMPVVSLSPHNVCMYMQGKRKWNPASAFHLKEWSSGQWQEERWLEGVIGMAAILWPPAVMKTGQLGAAFLVSPLT